MSQVKKGRSRKFRWIVLCGLVVGATLWYTGAVSGLVGSSASSAEQREELYNNALAQASASPTWPKSERELISAFWLAVASNNLKQATLYCPGSSEADYASYARLGPSTDIRVGDAQPHPRAKGVLLWPSQVKFSYFGNKTIKLATAKSPSGHFIIDGQNTIWW